MAERPARPTRRRVRRRSDCQLPVWPPPSAEIPPLVLLATEAPEAVQLPPLRIVHCDAARREAGTMLFNVRGDSRAEGKALHSGWLLGVDQAGVISCLHKSDRPVQGVRRKPDGNLLVTIVDGL